MTLKQRRRLLSKFCNVLAGAAGDHVGIGVGARGGANDAADAAIFRFAGIPATSVVKFAIRVNDAIPQRFVDELDVRLGEGSGGNVSDY